MYVLKRDGRREPVQFDKITARIKKLCYGLHDAVDPTKVAMRVIEGCTTASPPPNWTTLQRKSLPPMR